MRQIAPLLAALALAALAACAGKPTLRTEATAEERCIELVDVLCRKVEQCKYGQHATCMLEQAPACARVRVLPLADSQVCAQDMYEMQCGGALPKSCLQIGEVEE